MSLAHAERRPAFHLSFLYPIENGLAGDVRDAAILVLDEVIEQRVKPAPVEEQRRAEHEAQRVPKAEWFADGDEHGGSVHLFLAVSCASPCAN